MRNPSRSEVFKIYWEILEHLLIDIGNNPYNQKNGVLPMEFLSGKNNK